MAATGSAEPNARDKQLMLLISGLPAVGKSSLIAELGLRLDATLLSRDEVRRSAGPLRRLGDVVSFRLLGRRLTVVQRRATTGLLDAVRVELLTGRSVIVEALAEPELRHELTQLATTSEARFIVVECHCSDEAEYHRRLATRRGHWSEAARRLALTHEPDHAAIRVDTSGSSTSSAEAILAAIRQ